MAKIKRKVALEPKEFLKHLLKKEETTVELNGYTSDGEIFSFEPEVTINEFVSYYPYDNTYTVEIEEEVTEETKIPEMFEIFVNDGGVKRVEKSINELKDDFSKEFWLKDGNTMTLIWKDGELVGNE